ncbi:jun dimerization protein 2 isoform X3 [Equus quagga]|uniref:jun dimerization protein 2 isoform X3 n=1 Tax=Equus quagga TaxID=89248 RepID=UPI001EE1BC6B|nr:jun dimerization protein 2 isoform X3 [Equus quagga]
MALCRQVGRDRNDFLYRTGIQEQLCTNVLLTRLLRSQDCAHLSSRFSVPWAHSRWSTSDGWMDGWTAAPPAMMPGQIPDPSVTAGSLPGLGPLTGLPSSALTVEELKYADIRNIGAMIAPLHFLEVKLGKRPQPVKSEVIVGFPGTISFLAAL